MLLPHQHLQTPTPLDPLHLLRPFYLPHKPPPSLSRGHSPMDHPAPPNTSSARPEQVPKHKFPYASTRASSPDRGDQGAEANNVGLISVVLACLGSKSNSGCAKEGG